MNRLILLLTLLLSSFSLLSGDVFEMDRPTVAGKFDLVVANILVPVLHDLLVDLRQLLSVNGRLILAGFVKKERIPLVSKAQSLGLSVEKISDDSGWECVILKNGSPSAPV